ncbi:MAG: hypothetical protein A2X37_10205 [Elusimicrobia bacterium GWA2_66_18]|nr:MAG: hypothetical protein A2X37_10205 [Elusimicrobia bacterium GWA2_66_18]
MDPERRRIDAVWLAAAALALVAPALLRGHGLFPTGSLWRFAPWTSVLPHGPGNGLLSDQLLYFWPWRLFLHREVLSGHFPAWNPLIAAGVPFAACAQAAAFFPTEILLAWLPPVAWSLLSAFLKVFAAGLFTSLHARRLGASRAGAALSGVAFALCGFMVAWLGHPHANAACLLPALFWSLGRAFEQGRPRSWVAVALAVGGILLGGHPPTALHVLAACAAYAVFLSRRAPRNLAAAGLAALAGACLAAPALLTYFEYLGLSSTAAASQGLARWATRLSPWAVLHLLMPLASGSPAHGAEVLAAAFELGPQSNFLERAGWVGIVPLALAVLAAARRRREPEVIFLAGLALFGLAAALGAPPLAWVWKVLPGFCAVNPTRLLLVFAFASSVLAGLAADEEAGPRFLLAAGAVLLAALSACAWRYAQAWEGLTAMERGFAVGQCAAALVEGGAALAFLSRAPWRRWAPPAAALFLLRVGWGLNPSAAGSTLYPRTPGLARLAYEQGEGRVFALGWALPPDTGMALGLRDARGRDFASLRRYEEAVTGKQGDFDFYSAAAAPPPAPRLLALSALAATPRTVLAVPPGWEKVHAGDLLVFRAPEPGRRAVFVGEARAASPEQALAAVRAPDFDPGRVVWLDDGPVAASTTDARGVAHLLSETADEVLVIVQSDGPGWLLLLDSWYPGWTVRVNGRRAPLRRADYAFRAVAVPAGSTMVSFRFASNALRWGLLLAALAAAGLAAAWRRG